MNLLNNENLKWRHYKDDENFDYPIDYSDAVLDAREDGRLEILVRWAPNSYCHFHRHTAETSSVVLEGELKVTDIDLLTGQEKASRIRKVGDFVHKEPGDIHMERAGPEGAFVLFNIYDPEGDGILAESLSKSGEVLSTSSMKKILSKRV